MRCTWTGTGLPLTTCGWLGGAQVSYNTLLDGYGKAGRVQEALGVYERMKRVGVKPDR